MQLLYTVSLTEGCKDIGLTIVAVNGILSIRDDANAETHRIKIIATVKRCSSGTTWQTGRTERKD